MAEGRNPLRELGGVKLERVDSAGERYESGEEWPYGAGIAQQRVGEGGRG